MAFNFLLKILHLLGANKKKIGTYKLFKFIAYFYFLLKCEKAHMQVNRELKIRRRRRQRERERHKSSRFN